MKLIALILGLGLERAATALLHLREPRWLDAYFDFVLRLAAKVDVRLVALPAVAAVLLLFAPVLLVGIELGGTALAVWDLAYLLFAVAVVFFSLGPRDLATEVSEYCGALDRGEAPAAQRALVELTESGRTGAAAEQAIFVQATNRVFGVIFWFMLLGPAGAWLFRVGDLFRRRATLQSQGRPEYAAAAAAVEALHGVLTWVPARLAALGYAFSGSFDDALNAWRNYRSPEGEPFNRASDRVVALVGTAAMTGFLQAPESSSTAARNALRLVTRTLFIWVTFIAALTIVGWSV